MKNRNIHDYIMLEFFQFIQQKDNGIRTANGGLKLKPGIEYKWTQTPNPNSEQISDELWREIIIHNLDPFNNN